MMLYEVKVKNGKAVLFNPETSEKPTKSVFASEIEPVGIFTEDMARQYATLSFYGVAVALESEDKSIRSERQYIVGMNDEITFIGGVVEKLFEIGVAWIAEV